MAVIVAVVIVLMLMAGWKGLRLVARAALAGVIVRVLATAIRRVLWPL